MFLTYIFFFSLSGDPPPPPIRHPRQPHTPYSVPRDDDFDSSDGSDLSDFLLESDESDSASASDFDFSTDDDSTFSGVDDSSFDHPADTMSSSFSSSGTASSSRTSHSAINRERRKSIREAFLHAWRNYEQHAWGKDELTPVTGGSRNWIKGGLGMTIIDALDTAYIMGLDSVVTKSLSWIRTHLSFDIDDRISVFETTIRIVGGLLSAYDLIGDEILLVKATEIADRLLPAFQTKTGVPYSEVNLRTGDKRLQGWAGGTALLAEFGTLQLEFRRLSHLTGNPVYDQKVTHVMDVLDTHSRDDGQYPCFYFVDRDKFRGDLIKWGAWGDSFYEYLVKQWLLTNRTETRYRRMYDRAIEGMHKKLIKTNAQGFTYIVEVDNGRVSRKMDHLACFAIGMLAIGAEGERAQKDMAVAKELGRTCYGSYKAMASGLGPDSFTFDDRTSFNAGGRMYLLRPETVEGLMYLYRFTKDEMYREWGWEIFQAIEEKCKTDHGYATARDVTQANPGHVNEMHTFFLGETLKYLYLLFSPVDLVPLDEFVFNTEAHPLRITTP